MKSKKERAEKLYESIGSIDEKYVEEAKNHKSKNKKNIILKVIPIALAACICLTFGVSIIVPKLFGQKKSETDNSGITESIIYYNKANEISIYPEFLEESTPGAKEEMSNKLVENPFIKTSENKVSTFSSDVDTASYANLRGVIKQGYNLKTIQSMAQNGIFRTEELINYFDYGYDNPNEGNLLSYTSILTECPWNENASLLILGMKTEEKEIEADNNLVFLIDVSGSMGDKNKLELIKQAFVYLVEGLDSNDTISIVTYSGEEKVVLEGCKGNDRQTILNAINSLSANGCTNGEAGLKMAYQIAEKYRNDGNNRIIIASDGDLNVGISSTEEMEKFISEKRKSGVYLSTMGFGDIYNDGMMETIADCGNGVYYYIDCVEEAEKIFTEDIFKTLYTVGTDVKLQLEFNSDLVKEYRLIGYENRILSEEDFEDDTKDAGDIGAGHSLTVCYELVLDETVNTNNIGKLSVRYKDSANTPSKEEYYDIYENETESDYATFIQNIIRLSMIINNSQYKDNATLKDIENSLNGISSYVNADKYKAQFLELIKKLIINE